MVLVSVMMAFRPGVRGALSPRFGKRGWRRGNSSAAIGCRWNLATEDRANRSLIEAAALETGDRFQGIWLEADPQLLRQRVNDRSGGPSDATTEVLSMQLARKSEDTKWRQVDASLPINQIIHDILI